MTIRSILVAAVATLENHAANRGEKLLGNASSVKRRPDGRVYISGQMQRHVLFSAIDRLNEADPDKGDTYVSNGDGISNQIAKDLRGDLGGFMNPQLGEYSGRRTAPLSVTPAVALRESAVGQDLLIRLKMNEGKSEKKQAFATNEFSQSDEMAMNFHLDVGAVGAIKQFVYEEEIHVNTQYESKIDDAEHQRRIRLALEATRYMTDYANQARHAVSGEPNRVLIVLDPGMSRKAIQYWTSSEVVQRRILEELDHRKALYFIGDDADAEADSVFQAYRKAMNAVTENELFRPKFQS